MRDKVTKQRPQTTRLEEKAELKQIRAEVIPLTSLTPYRWTKPAHAEQTHYVLDVCDSECIAVELDTQQCTYSAVWLLGAWCHVKLLPSQCTFCVYLQPCTRFQCHLIRSHIRTVHVCIAVTCHLHFGQTDRDLLRSLR